MHRWIANTLGIAILAALGLAAWGCFGLNHAAIVLLQDTDKAVRAVKVPPVDPHVLQSILAHIDAFTKDAADEMHEIAHPTKGQQALKVVHSLIPGIF